MGPFNRGVYTKDIFCKRKMGDRPNLLGLGPQSAARSRVVSYPEWVVTTQRSSAMRQKRGGNSEVAGLSETVWGQGA